MDKKEIMKELFKKFLTETIDIETYLETMPQLIERSQHILDAYNSMMEAKDEMDQMCEAYVESFGETDAIKAIRQLNENAYQDTYNAFLETIKQLEEAVSLVLRIKIFDLRVVATDNEIIACRYKDNTIDVAIGIDKNCKISITVL